MNTEKRYIETDELIHIIGYRFSGYEEPAITIYTYKNIYEKEYEFGMMLFGGKYLIRNTCLYIKRFRKAFAKKQKELDKELNDC